MEKKKASELPPYSIIENASGKWLRVQITDAGLMGYEEMSPHCGECTEYILDTPESEEGEKFRRKWYGHIPLEHIDEVFTEFEILAMGVTNV